MRGLLRALMDPFEGSKLKTIRASHHIGNFQTVYNAFVESEPVAYHCERDTQRGRTLHKARLTKPIFPDLRLIAADALYNLRSALDAAVCASAKLAGNAAKETYFPHGKDIKGFERSLGRNCKKVPHWVVRALRSLEPYYGGNGDLLRVLHDLNLTDKHTDLIRVAPVLAGVHVQSDNVFLTNTVWAHAEDEVIFAETVSLGFDQPVNVSLAVSFAESPPPVIGKSVLVVLRKLHEEVVKATASIEKAAAQAS